MSADEDRGAPFRDHVVRALRIADEASVELLESECRAHRIDDVEWLDTEQLLDTRWFSPATLERHVDTIAHGIERRLIERHPDPARQHLVRVLRRP